MADEVIRLTRRVSDIGLKPGFRFHLKIRPQGFKSTRRLSAFSVGFLLKNTLNENRNELGSEQESSAAVQRYSRTSAGPVFFNPNVVVQKTFCGKVTLFRRPVSKHDWIFIRTYSGNGGNEEPLYRNKTAYYEILGISASATQAQIKTAYYKQSFAYHPDRNAGSEDATLRFSEINEAYTVLGNKALRKKYDHGLLSSSDLTASAKPSVKDTRSATKRQTDTRGSVMGQGRSAEMFDFDKFYKAHYGEQLQREKDLRERRERLKNRKEKLAEQKLDRSLELGLGLVLCLFLWIVQSLKNN